MNTLQSRRGDIKSIEEWRKECDLFYKDLGLSVSKQWERFNSVMGLRHIGEERRGDYRKPVRAQKEGLTTWGHEND